MPLRRMLALVLLLSLVPLAAAQDEPEALFTSLSVLQERLAAEPAAWEGRRVTVHGLVAADFFRDLYLSDVGGSATPGLRVRSGDHAAEEGDVVLCRGQLRRDERSGGHYLEIVEPYSDLLPLREQGVHVVTASAVSAAGLHADPEAWRGRFVRLDNLVVTALRRDATAVPWLLVAEDAAGVELSVELRDALHPPLREGDPIAALSGIWDRQGEYWNLRPRSGDDWRIGEGLARGARPLERPLDSKIRPLERKISGGMGRTPEARPLLDAICYDPVQAGEGEGAESFAVINAGDRPIDLAGWTVTDNEGSFVFPTRTKLRPGRSLRVARRAERFAWEFGFSADLFLQRDAGAEADSLILDNGGDELLLLDPRGRVVDAVVWEAGWSDAQPGWSGPGAAPYRYSDYVPAAGQVLWRKRDPADGLPLDSDTFRDWIGDPDDPVLGQRFAFAGWDGQRFADTARCEETAEVRALVSPDNSFEGVRDFLRSAQSSLEIALYLFTHPGLADELVAAMDRGVRVTLLLDGEVFGARGGTYDSVRAIASRIQGHASGLGAVYFWRNGDDPRHTGMDADLPDRYNHVHMKYVIADRARVLIGSDNFTQSSLPADDKANGTGGSRGAFLATDASCVVERVVAVWEADFDPRHHLDIRQHFPHPDLEERPPRLGDDRDDYEPVQTAPYARRERARFELSQSPDNSLRSDRGYLGHVNAAGPGDLVLVQQQYERPWWGYGEGREPNPRLQAYVEAARRGARVRILLNGAGGDTRNGKSRLTVSRFNELAREEELDLLLALGHLPDSRSNRDRPIHNKMLLVSAGDAHWCHVGSANGSETANRFNRELGLSIDSAGLYAYLAEVFAADWLRATGESAAGP